MSDNNSFKCGKCGGSGKRYCQYWMKNDAICLDCMMPNCKDGICPKCNKGNVQLAIAVPAEHEGGTGYYRPLTDEEVRELEHEHGFSMSSIMEEIAKCDYNVLEFKGSKVVLIPKEDV